MIQLSDPLDEKMPLIWRLKGTIESIKHVAGRFVDKKTTSISGSDNAELFNHALQRLRQIEEELDNLFPIAAARRGVNAKESLVWRLQAATSEFREATDKFTLGVAHHIQGRLNRERLAFGMHALSEIHAELEALFPSEFKFQDGTS